MSSSFPTTYDAYATDTLLAAYLSGPSHLRRALDGLTGAELSARPRPNKWSIGEVAMHMADADLVGAERIRRTIAEPGARLVSYDQDVWAGALGYQAADPTAILASLRLFELLRETTGRLFQGLRNEQWRQSSDHSAYGAVTLRNLLEVYADHGERHIQQILDMRRLLQRPLELTPLLPERLY